MALKKPMQADVNEFLNDYMILCNKHGLSIDPIHSACFNQLRVVTGVDKQRVIEAIYNATECKDS